MIGLIAVFGAILTGKQSGQKLHCWYGNPTANNVFNSSSNFTQYMNRNVKIPRRILYSPSLKDIACLELAQLIFLIFHTFVFKFGRVEGAAREKKLQTSV